MGKAARNKKNRQNKKSVRVIPGLTAAESREALASRRMLWSAGVEPCGRLQNLVDLHEWAISAEAGAHVIDEFHQRGHGDYDEAATFLVAAVAAALIHEQVVVCEQQRLMTVEEVAGICEAFLNPDAGAGARVIESAHYLRAVAFAYLEDCWIDKHRFAVEQGAAQVISKLEKVQALLDSGEVTWRAVHPRCSHAAQQAAA